MKLKRLTESTIDDTILRLKIKLLCSDIKGKKGYAPKKLVKEKAPSWANAYMEAGQYVEEQPTYKRNSHFTDSQRTYYSYPVAYLKLK